MENMARYLRRMKMCKNFSVSVFNLILISIVLTACISNSIAEEVRSPSVAGSYYPGSASELRNMVTGMLDAVPEDFVEGKIYGAMAPHAGYVFSGQVAAYTFKQLSRVEFDTIVIIGHDSYRNAVAYTCPVDYFLTPLGKVPVDRDMIERMHAFNRGIRANQSIHSDDPSIEVQLPFLQVMGKNCKIVPILFGNPTTENCRILADAIIEAAGDKKVVVLASTDMSHYPPYESANRIDGSTLEELKEMDVEKLFDHLDKQQHVREVPNLRTTMCAKGGVGTAILFAKAHGAGNARILHYANSGDASIGDKQQVVGYSSVLFFKP
jgi:AmmeMemoRadiSam system protein B